MKVEKYITPNIMNTDSELASLIKRILIKVTEEEHFQELEDTFRNLEFMRKYTPRPASLKFAKVSLPSADEIIKSYKGRINGMRVMDGKYFTFMPKNLLKL